MPARVALVGVGSRGDVQPYIALGQRFVQEGHPTTLVTTREFAPLARSHGIEVEEAQVSIQAAMTNQSTARAIEGGGLISSFLKFREIAARARSATTDAIAKACVNADVLVVGFGMVSLAHAVQIRTGIPIARAYNVPITPTSEFPGALFPWLSLPPRSITHRLGHWLTNQALWTVAGASAERTLGALPRLAPPWLSEADHDPIIYGISPHVLPRPADWPAGATMDGFWFAREPDDWTPPVELEAFLAGGDPPVYIGFGSMTSDDRRSLTHHVVEASREAGVRAILHQGWAGLGGAQLPNTVHLVGSVPHSWLFPRMAAVVHHGGAGTTAAAFRAGRPQVVVPFHGDQPFWAVVAHRAGVGPKPLPRRSVTATSLAQAIAHAHQPQAVARATQIGALVAAEDGCGTTVRRVINRLNADVTPFAATAR